eukprot:Gregarina_sp_Poly_1__3259@NODE_1930_length_3056_cov_69_221144_g205_i1_p1_GENE_NODE_1930_length_3056_cov_69_221144_g205_i1NODE_1930_length_3056_cov_69_221144_g205_i1_p1_ORF_typecomplete_len182_score10_56Ndc1_Nup/PF09531_10/0_88DUF1129/PF06570_11/0_66DUF2070/PF09843_9/1_2DUF2663/PF10864_8/1_2DUF2663/PF10864_8/1_3e03_NODE_1930_length_3056_cov_69_221144_g205_i110951640
MARQTVFNRRPVGGGPAPLYCNNYRNWTKTGAHACSTVGLAALVTLIVTNLLDLAGSCTTKLMTNLETISLVISLFFSAVFSAYLYIVSSHRWFSDEELQNMTSILIGSVLLVLCLSGLDAFWAFQIIQNQRICEVAMVASYVKFGFTLLGTSCVAIVAVLNLAKTISEMIQQQQVLMSVF